MYMLKTEIRSSTLTEDYAQYMHVVCYCACMRVCAYVW